MKYFNEGFYGRESYYVTDDAGGDSYNKFVEYCKTQPDDWYYRDKTISYDFNKYGHRCKDLDNIDLNNYILFLGCSHTEGIGLELETSYPYLIAKDLNMDYYNLALAATGDDISFYNAFIFMQTVGVKPKYVVIQWSDMARSARYITKNEQIMPAHIGENIDNNTPFFIYGEISGFFQARRYFIEQMYRKIFSDVPIIYVNFTEYSEDNFYTREYFPEGEVMLEKYDLARDLSHCGIKSNRILADNILDIINTKYNNEIANNINGGKI